MASSYPGGYDSLAKPTATTKEDDAGFEHDIVHTNEANAIEAVQATLGLSPQGASATVKARLDAVDTSLSGKVGTSDSRLSDARTPTAHAASHAVAGSDTITISPSQVTGTAVVTSDSRLSDARTPTAHAASHGSAGSDAITVAQSQVTNLTTDLSGKVGTARSISTTAPLAGGGDLSADRTLTIADASTSVKGAVQLTDSTSSTSTTTAATPNAVKSAYDLANGAVPKSTVTTLGDLIVANGASSVTRLAAGTSGQVLTANGTGVAPTWQAATGDGKLFVQEGATTPNNANGNNGDFMVLTYDGGMGGSNYARLIGPKAAGAWPTGGASSQINSAGDYIGLPQRSKTMKSSDLIPGWAMDFDTAWATGTVPTDLSRDGTFGGAWYSSAAGTTVGISRYRSVTGTAPMAFFSGQFKITTLPEATRFFYFGQIVTLGGSIYGYCARIDSAGAVTIRIEDAVVGSSTLDSGMTVAVNDSVLVERFGYRFTVMKTATTGREWLDADATATSRPLNARIGQGSTDALYARQLGGSSFGLATNSASVRVSEVGFAG